MVDQFLVKILFSLCSLKFYFITHIEFLIADYESNIKVSKFNGRANKADQFYAKIFISFPHNTTFKIGT